VSDAASIFAAAAERARQMGLPYAGAVTPEEAHRLREMGAARIVDVRSAQEWQHVGHVDGAPLVEWPRNGDRQAVAAFVEKVEDAVDPGEPVLFLCRSGVRSHYAAQVTTQAGFQRAYNILEGFEGVEGVRGGWRNHGLPWKKG
jgi:rhodanese-related sulfurtransferase